VVFPRFSHSTKPLDTLFDAKDFGLLHEYARSHSMRTYRNGLQCRREREVNAPLLMFDPRRGLFLFDHADWCFETLRSARASSARLDAKAPRDVNVDTGKRILRQKLDASDDTRRCEVCSFLYLPSLSSTEFGQLDPTFAQLLPASKLIFADDTLGTIHQKLTQALPYLEDSLNGREVLAALFPHYALHPEERDASPVQPSYHQVQYLEADLPERSLLFGAYGSGKSALLVLKAVREQLRAPSSKIAIIAPTVVACELMAKQLLDTIEYAVLPLDPTAIRILTPEQVIEEHHRRVHRKPPLRQGEITPKMMRKPYPFADLLFCDDAHLLPPHYLDYIRQLQGNGQLHFAALESGADVAMDAAYPLPHAFRSPWTLGRYSRRSVQNSQQLHLLEGNAYIRTLLLLTRLLSENPGRDILIVPPDAAFARNLLEEIESYLGCHPQLLDPHKSLLNQNMEELLVAGADGLSGLQRPHVIVIDDGHLDDARLAHAVSRAGRHAYIITGSTHGKSDQE
jgi:hypothetical protein